jgi:hypothetical protein
MTDTERCLVVLAIAVVLVVGGGTITFWHHVFHVWPARKAEEQRQREAEYAKARQERERTAVATPHGGNPYLQERIKAAEMRIRLREAGVPEDQVKQLDALHREAFR